jgi:hypothetical protein
VRSNGTKVAVRITSHRFRVSDLPEASVLQAAIA